MTHQTPTTDFHSPFTDRLTLRQSLLRRVVVGTSFDEAPEFAEELERVVEERPSAVWLEERGDIALSALRPSGFLLLFTGSRGLSSC
jgi:hypothetical protein